jgi:hypothetical protein
MTDQPPVDHRGEAEKHAARAARLLGGFSRDSAPSATVSAHQQQAFLHLALSQKAAA